MLDKAHLSLDDKAKTKALLDLHKAIQESEDNEEGGSDPQTQVHQATMLREVKVKKHQCCS